MADLKAITNWLGANLPGSAGGPTTPPSLYCSIIRILAIAATALPTLTIPAAPKFTVPPPSLSPKFADTARTNLNHWKAQYAKNPASNTNASQLARAYFLMGEFATNKTHRAKLAHAGIEISQTLIDRVPQLAEGWYYHGLNSGQFARTKMLGALSLVRGMERSFQRSISINPRLDHAGAHRCLGLLYRDAPGWPISVGSRKKARHHLDTANRLAPAYPENPLILMETWIRWRDNTSLKRDAKTSVHVHTKAQEKFKGEKWTAYWADWNARWNKISSKIEKIAD